MLPKKCCIRMSLDEQIKQRNDKNINRMNQIIACNVRQTVSNDTGSGFFRMILAKVVFQCCRSWGVCKISWEIEKSKEVFVGQMKFSVFLSCRSTRNDEY